MVQEFKDFINRGNLVEIAVAFVMGVAFADVIAAFTSRIVSPLIGMILNLENIDRIGTFGDAVGEDGVPVGSLGAFIEALINFLIVALVMFFVVRAYNRMKASFEDPVEEDAPEPSDEVKLLGEIRDALRR